MKKLIQSLAICLLAGVIGTSLNQPNMSHIDLKPISLEELAEPIPEPQIKAETVTRSIDSVYTPADNVNVQLSGGVLVKDEPLMSREDIELIALVTMAEAEGECEKGKRLVIDTILNRVDYGYMGGDTVSEIVYQPGQFSSMWNGRVDRCEVTEEVVQLVEEELESRTNEDVMYFHAGKYGKYGTPMFSVENHYFSSI